VARRSITAQQVQLARTVLAAARLWLAHSRWGPLVARAATLVVASASAAGGWKLASYLFSRKRLPAPAVVVLEAPSVALELRSAIDYAIVHSAAVDNSTYTDAALEELHAAPVMLAAKPDCESVVTRKERDGPSPVFEAEEDELEHRPEDVVDTRTAIRSVRNKPGRTVLPLLLVPVL
jgi:hypothetical protein